MTHCTDERCLYPFTNRTRHLEHHDTVPVLQDCQGPGCQLCIRDKKLEDKHWTENGKSKCANHRTSSVQRPSNVRPTSANVRPTSANVRPTSANVRQWRHFSHFLTLFHPSNTFYVSLEPSMSRYQLCLECGKHVRKIEKKAHACTKDHKRH